MTRAALLTAEAFDTLGVAALGDYSHEVQSDDATNVPCDGSRHDLTLIMASPPEWLDTAGNIILPGLYQVIAEVNVGTPPTLPGLVGAVSTAFDATYPIALDAIPLISHLFLPAVQALAESDLPYPLGFQVVAQNDDTGILSVQISATRLAALASVGAP